MNEQTDSSSVAAKPSTPLSQLLESVVIEQELTYWRLQEDILMVTHEANELIFASLAGPSVTTFAERIACNQAMAFRYLNQRNIPAQKALMVPIDAFDHAAKFAESHHVDLTARWSMYVDSTVRLGSETFYRDWETFVSDQPDLSGEIILQPRATDNQIDIAVAYGQADTIDSGRDHDQLANAEKLALSAIAALPHAEYGLVTVDLDQVQVTGIDLTFRAWEDAEPTALARRFASIILDGELRTSQKGNKPIIKA